MLPLDFSNVLWDNHLTSAFSKCWLKIKRRTWRNGCKLAMTCIKTGLKQLLPALGRDRLPAGRQRGGSLSVAHWWSQLKFSNCLPTHLQAPKEGKQRGGRALAPRAPRVCCQRSLGGKISVSHGKGPVANYAVRRMQESGRLCSGQPLQGRASPPGDWPTKARFVLSDGAGTWLRFGWVRSPLQWYSLQPALKDSGAEG